MTTTATKPEAVDQFGFTHAERVKQFTVTGWSPERQYRWRKGSVPRSWFVISPNESVQDHVATKREAVTYTNDRNANAEWAYGGGIGAIPGHPKIRFQEPAEA